MRLRLRPPDSSAARFERGWLVLGAPLLGAFLALLRLRPFAESSTVICSVRRMTGRPCLTCGATRSWSAFVRGDPAEAFAMNPLAAVVLIGLLLMTLYAAAALALRLPRVRLTLHPPRDWFVLGTLAVAALAANYAYLWKASENW